MEDIQSTNPDCQITSFSLRPQSLNSNDWNLSFPEGVPSQSNIAPQEKDITNLNSYPCSCANLPLSFPDPTWNNVGYSPYNGHSHFSTSAYCIVDQEKKQNDPSSVSQLMYDDQIPFNMKDLPSDVKQYDFPVSSCMKELPSNSNDCNRVINYAQNSVYSPQFSTQDSSLLLNNQLNSGNSFGLCLETDCIDKLCSPSKHLLNSSFPDNIDVDSRTDFNPRISSDFSSDLSQIINVTSLETNILKDRDSDECSDIIVEDSDTESEISIDGVPFDKTELNIDRITTLRCFVCNLPYSYNLCKNFVEVSSCAPLTFISQTPVLLKLIEIIPVDMQTSVKFENSLICKRCLNLIDVIENLEVKLDSFKKAICDFISRSNKSPKEDDWRSETNIRSCTGREAQINNLNFVDSATSRVVQNDHIDVPAPDVIAAESELLLLSDKCHMCDRCGKVFLREKELFSHLDKHAGVFSEICSECGKGFHKKSNLEVHMRVHRIHCCGSCRASFKTETELLAHVKACKGNCFSCTQCSLMFTNQKILDSHKEKHKINLKSCQVCFKTFKHQSDLTSHMDSHSDKKPFSCDKCNKCYKKQSHLRRHMKTHETYFKCFKCTAAFKSSSEFKKHSLTHTEKVECNICFKSYIDKKALLEHKKIVHSEETNNRKECPVCKKFIRNNLKVHMLKHSATKNFKCDVCNIEFTFKQSLAKHNRQKHSTQV